MKLVLAWGLLSEAERQVVSDIPYLRESASVPVDPGDAPYSGKYRPNAVGGAVLVAFDLAFDHDETGFLGTPDAPIPTSVGTLIHEVGHALDGAERRRLRSVRGTLVKEMGRLAPELEAAKAAAEEAVARHQSVYESALSAGADWRREWGGPLDRAAEASAAALEQHETLLGPYEEARLRSEVLLAHIKHQDAGNSPMLVAFGRVEGAMRGMTKYGTTSLKENFAVAFSLWKCDPKALTRIAPEVHAWFEAGEHIRIVREGLERPLPEAPP